LEFGCFNGFFVSELLHLGADAHGIELNENAIQVGNDRFGLSGRLHSTLDAPVLGQRPFDDVLCIDVLEHLEDPAALIARASDLLQPNGRIFVAGPTVERGFFDKTDYPPHHQWRFSRRGLTHLLERKGFDVNCVLVQHDGMLLVRNLIGKILNSPKGREFYGDISIVSPSTEKGLARVLYKILSTAGTALFTTLRIPYCSAVIVAQKRV
jgi:SAM-dependent methyltransferase